MSERLNKQRVGHLHSSDLVERIEQLEAEKAEQSEYFDAYMGFKPGTNWLKIHTETKRRAKNLSRINRELIESIERVKTLPDQWWKKCDCKHCMGRADDLKAALEETGGKSDD